MNVPGSYLTIHFILVSVELGPKPVLDTVCARHEYTPSDPVRCRNTPTPGGETPWMILHGAGIYPK